MGDIILGIGGLGLFLSLIGIVYYSLFAKESLHSDKWWLYSARLGAVSAVIIILGFLVLTLQLHYDQI